MIHSVTSNKNSFRSVYFHAGLNVILADRSMSSSSKDSRNALGKTTLLSIIDFCLGASTTSENTPCIPSLSGWEFTLTFDVAGKTIQATRSVDDPQSVRVTGNELPTWPAPAQVSDGALVFSLKTWNYNLGWHFFGLEGRKHELSFRSVLGYFIRIDKNSFDEPFQYFQKQNTISKRIHTAFLLDLSWQLASEWGRLAKEKSEIGALDKALKEIEEEGKDNSLGALEARRVQLRSVIRSSQQGLHTFRVTPNYHDIEQQANGLTKQIQQAHNENSIDAKTLEGYERSIKEETYLGEDKIIDLYRSARIELPGCVTRRLRDVRDFHRAVINNRKMFLEAEARNLRAAIKDRTNHLSMSIDKRAKLLEILKTTGALDEYTKLQEMHVANVEMLKSIEQKIESVRKLSQKSSALRVETELLFSRTSQDLIDRAEQKDAAIDLFDANSRFLYDKSGTLKIEAKPTGLFFGVNIPAKGSYGVNNMQIFSFDITVSQLWASKQGGPGFLIHDSLIFADVDERQTAKALELAHRESQRFGFQYICALNSDSIPTSDFSEGFNLSSHVVLRLTDESEAHSLLGMRFKR